MAITDRRIPAVYVDIDDKSTALESGSLPRSAYLVIVSDRGRHNRVVKKTTRAEFFKEFGQPNLPKTGYGHYLADIYYKWANSLYVVRVTPDGATYSNMSLQYNDPESEIYTGSKLAEGDFAFTNATNTVTWDTADSLQVAKITVGSWIFGEDDDYQNAQQVILKDVDTKTLTLDDVYTGTTTVTGDNKDIKIHVPFEIISTIGIKSESSLSPADDDIIWHFYPIGPGTYYNNLYLKGVRNTDYEKIYIDSDGDPIYKYAFIDLYLYETLSDGTSTLIEGPWTVSLINQTLDGAILRDVVSGNELYLPTVVNTNSKFIKVTEALAIGSLLNGVDIDAKATSIAATATLDLNVDIVLTHNTPGTLANTDTLTLAINAAAGNPGDTILAVVSGTAEACVLTITPNTGGGSDINPTGTLDLTTPIILTATDGVLRNGDTVYLNVNAGADHGGGDAYVTITGDENSIIITVEPDTNIGTPVPVTTSLLTTIITTGAGAGVTITDTSNLLDNLTATGGDATNLTNGGEGDGVTATFSGGIAATPATLTGAGLANILNGTEASNITLTDTLSLLDNYSAVGGDSTVLVTGGEGDGEIATFSGGLDESAPDPIVEQADAEKKRLQVLSLFTGDSVFKVNTVGINEFQFENGSLGTDGTYTGLNAGQYNSLGTLDLASNTTLAGKIKQAYDGSLTSVDGTIENISQTIYTWYLFDYIFSGGYSLDIQAGAKDLASVREDVLNLSDTGTSSINADADITIRQTLQTWNTPNSAIYCQYRQLFDKYTGKKINMTPVYHAIDRHLYTDSVYWISEPPAGIEKGAIEDAVELAYIPNITKLGDLQDAGINSIITEPDGVYILTQLTAYKKLSILKRQHVVKFIHYIKKTIPGLLKDVLQHKATNYWVNEVKYRLDAFMNQYVEGSGPDKYASIKEFSHTVVFDELRSEINVVMSIKVLRSIEKINIRLTVV